MTMSVADKSGKDSSILVFVPTFNDTAMLAELVGHIKALALDVEVLVVDDGSSADVSAVLADSDCLFVRLPANVGLGACTAIAFDHALRNRYEAMVRVDADGQHPVDRIADLVAGLSGDDAADIVTGSRRNRNVGVGIRAALSRLVRGYLFVVGKLITRRRAPRDIVSGFFAINRYGMKVLNEYLLDRYPEPQMYIIAARRNLRIDEIEVDQSDRQHGISTLTLEQAMRQFYRFNVFILAELLQRSRSSRPNKR